jgi:O-methyltransferase involved in polyketide biosynthesis
MTTFKQDIVRKLALASVQPVHPVAVDFASQSFVEQLSQAGYPPAQSTGVNTHKHTLFIIEGLINYLSEDKAEELLQTVASSYPGALVALTSRLSPPAYSAAELRRRREIDAQLRGVGEPHQFAMPRDADVFFRRHGFAIVDQITRPLANLRSEVAEKDHDYAVFLLKAAPVAE